MEVTQQGSRVVTRGGRMIGISGVFQLQLNSVVPD